MPYAGFELFTASAADGALHQLAARPAGKLLAPYAEQFPFKYEANERRELVPYLAKAPATPPKTDPEFPFTFDLRKSE